jgi:quercetin dioxygenase-like cupin family protein
MDEFGCFSLIGHNGFFNSDQMNAWMVYMPAGLYYPWHQHPAEEMYLCLAGEAVFKKDGAPDKHMGEGGVTLHASNQPHAMETLDHPVLCYVVWRNEFTTKPVLTYDDAT